MAEPVKIDRPNLMLDGTITVELKNGRHFTYRLRTCNGGPLDGRRIVQLLCGPDNARDYTAWGFIGPRGQVWVWNKYKTEAYAKHADLLTGRADEHVSAWYQASRCAKCGRLLTDPESIALGMGPVCSRRSPNG